MTTKSPSIIPWSLCQWTKRVVETIATSSQEERACSVSASCNTCLFKNKSKCLTSFHPLPIDINQADVALPLNKTFCNSAASSFFVSCFSASSLWRLKLNSRFSTFNSEAASGFTVATAALTALPIPRRKIASAMSWQPQIQCASTMLKVASKKCKKWQW